MINQKKFSFISHNGISNISGFAFFPDSLPRKGYFQVLHDKYENINRYHSILKKFAGQGYVAFGHDHLGHGLSISNQGELGLLIGDHPEIRLIDDANQFFNLVKKELPIEKNDLLSKSVPDSVSLSTKNPKIIPHILLGVGIGSTIAKLYLMKYPDVNLLLYCGDKGLDPLRFIDFLYCSLLVKRFGPQSFSENFEDWIERKFNSNVNSPSSKFDWRLRDSKQLSNLLLDDSAPKRYSLGFHHAVLKLHLLSTSRKWIRAYPKFLSSFFISGKHDPVSNYTRYLSPFISKLGMYGAQNIFFKFYDDARHDLLFDINQQEVYRDILSFIQTTVNQQFKQ